MSPSAEPGVPDIPLPGQPVRGSSGGKPIMALLDLLGRRWALRVIWELREETLLFRSLQRRCESMSSSVLNQRLRELRTAGIIELTDGGYRLTTEGRLLLDAYPPINAWAERWAQRIRNTASNTGSGCDADPAGPTPAGRDRESGVRRG